MSRPGSVRQDSWRTAVLAVDVAVRAVVLAACLLVAVAVDRLAGRESRG